MFRLASYRWTRQTWRMAETARQSHAPIWTLVAVLVPMLYLASVPPVVVNLSPKALPQSDPSAFRLRDAPLWADAYSQPYFQLMTPNEGILWSYWDWWWTKSH